MKISFITTVFNEEKAIEKFLDSLLAQTKLPDEVVIVDGGSTDKTVEKIRNQQLVISNKKIILKLLIKKGNRSVGRNEAIRNATGDIIVCSDSGNILDKKWVEEIVKPFGPHPDPLPKGEEKKWSGGVDVVAGYYKGIAKNVFQKCLIPYVLVMPDKVDPDNFLPATRSVAFTKAIWKKVGGFDEKLSHNEDYVFAHKLKEAGVKIFFAKDAIVNWIPRNSFKEAFVMFFRFALGDAEAGIWRNSVLLLFARYFLALYFIFLSYLYKSSLILYTLFFILLLYLAWSIKKNYRYVKEKEAFKILPLMQLTADAAVLSGTIGGVIKNIWKFNYWQYIKQNKFLFFIITVYVGILLLTLHWGIPNQNNPFPYHMDEWHQLQAVANTYRYGTPNTDGSANGTMFHFLLSGFYLIPFMLLKVIDPFALQIDNLLMREKVFEVLRFQTIIFGVLSIFVLYKIAELLKASKKLVIFLFTFTPIWLMLSGYFKYDIALMFWILLSLYSILYFAKNPSSRNFILTAIPASLAIAVKVSAMPLIVLYIFSYFWFSPSWKKNIKVLILGVGIFISGLLLLGFPDTIFGKGNILYYLYNNIIESRQVVSNINVGINEYVYLFFVHYPLMFGYGLMALFAISIGSFIYQFFKHDFRKSLYKYKLELFLLVSLGLFVASLLTIKIASAGNRTLVILPFLILFSSLVYKKISVIKNMQNFLLVVIVAVAIVQSYTSFAWIYMKVVNSPQESASVWIERNISKGQVIGIENIPIYQNLPDIVQKEFYFKQYKIDRENRYKYEIIGSSSNKLPSYVILTNGEIETKILKQPKRVLIKRLEKEGYKKVAVFSPEFSYYKLFGRDVDYYISGIVAAPITTSIYKK